MVNTMFFHECFEFKAGERWAIVTSDNIWNAMRSKYSHQLVDCRSDDVYLGILRVCINSLIRVDNSRLEKVHRNQYEPYAKVLEGGVTLGCLSAPFA